MCVYSLHRLVPAILDSMDSIAIIDLWFHSRDGVNIIIMRIQVSFKYIHIFTCMYLFVPEYYSGTLSLSPS